MQAKTVELRNYYSCPNAARLDPRLEQIKFAHKDKDGGKDRIIRKTRGEEL